MRYIAMLAVLALFTSAAYAQDTSLNSKSQSCPWSGSSTTSLEKTSYVVASSLVFSLSDYVAFNLLKKANHNDDFHAPLSFRIAEGLMQAAITYFLYKECGLSSAFSFNLTWWTWGDDFAYYGWGQLLSWFPWESRAQSGLRFNSYNSAGWTPIGLTRPQGTWIAKSTLIAQAVLGFSISMAILW